VRGAGGSGAVGVRLDAESVVVDAGSQVGADVPVAPCGVPKSMHACGVPKLASFLQIADFCEHRVLAPHTPSWTTRVAVRVGERSARASRYLERLRDRQPGKGISRRPRAGEFPEGHGPRFAPRLVSFRAECDTAGRWRPTPCFAGAPLSLMACRSRPLLGHSVPLRLRHSASGGRPALPPMPDGAAVCETSC
jgi:hypothetical protein